MVRRDVGYWIERLNDHDIVQYEIHLGFNLVSTRFESKPNVHRSGTLRILDPREETGERRPLQ